MYEWTVSPVILCLCLSTNLFNLDLKGRKSIYWFIDFTCPFKRLPTFEIECLNFYQDEDRISPCVFIISTPYTHSGREGIRAAPLITASPSPWPIACATCVTVISTPYTHSGREGVRAAPLITASSSPWPIACARVSAEYSQSSIPAAPQAVMDPQQLTKHTAVKGELKPLRSCPNCDRYLFANFKSVLSLMCYFDPISFSFNSKLF